MNLNIYFLIDIHYEGGSLHISNLRSGKDVSYMGRIYSGLGGLLTISDIKESPPPLSNRIVMFKFYKVPRIIMDFVSLNIEKPGKIIIHIIVNENMDDVTSFIGSWQCPSFYNTADFIEIESSFPN